MSGFLRTGIRRSESIWVTVLPSGRKLRMASGDSLLQAVLETGNEVARECGGKARCGSCLVRIRQGWRGLSKVKQDERELLARIGEDEKVSRLSCFALLGTHEVTIELLNH
jgi:ferredoxin, 2Fe-2S